jgi:hypothetical protein
MKFKSTDVTPTGVRKEGSMRGATLRTWCAFLAGLAVGPIVLAAFGNRGRLAIAQGPAEAAAPAAIEALRSELEIIKGKLPDQAHAMQDVGYHFSNLWFAARARHWLLAAFYNQEVLSHLKWAVRIIPTRKDSLGQEIDLEEILEAFENSPWTDLKNAIAAEDDAAFERAYRFALENCYACHKASDKPFIRPQMPEEPETPIINFDPGAEWPR